MPRYRVYSDPLADPARAQAIENLAGAFFPDPREMAVAEARMLEGRKAGQDIRVSQSDMAAREATSAAARQGNLPGMLAEALLSSDPRYVEAIPGTNLALYAAGGAGELAADPLRDQTMTRLQMGTGQDARTTGLGQVFAEEQDTRRTDTTTRRQLEGTRYSADQRLRGEQYGADRRREADIEAARIRGESNEKKLDPYLAATRLEKLTAEMPSAIGLAFGDSADFPLDPQLGAVANGIAMRYVQDQLAQGNVVSSADAANYAREQLIARSGGVAPQATGDWSPAANVTTIPGFDPTGAAAVFAPPAVGPAELPPAPAREARVPGQVYSTPKGPMRWMGSGWQPAG